MGAKNVTGVFSEAEFQKREAKFFRQRLREADAGTAEELEKALSAFRDAMIHHRSLIGKAVANILRGDFDEGAKQYGLKLVAESEATGRLVRMVRELLGVAAALEWSAPKADAIRMYEALLASERNLVADEVLKVVKRVKAGQL